MITPDRIIKLGHGFRAAKTLLSAVELDVFTALADGPLDTETLQANLDIASRGTRDFFDALVALGMLERDEDGRYANTAEADFYLDRRKPSYIGGELEHFGNYVYPHWSRLTEALRTGQPQSGARATGGLPGALSRCGPARRLRKGHDRRQSAGRRGIGPRIPMARVP